MMVTLTEIDWNAWSEYWGNVSHATLTQSWEYGEAKSKAQGWRANRFLLKEENGRPLGLLQALSLSVPIIGGIARINRGPVFFDDMWKSSPSVERVKEVTMAIIGTAKRRRWRYLSIAPNFPARPEIYAVLEGSGYRKNTPWCSGSATISLERSLGEIRAGFHSRWRNRLTRAEEIGLELEVPPAEDALGFFMDKYDGMMKERGCKSIPRKLIEGMLRQEGPSWTFLVLFGRRNGIRVGGHLVVGYGDTSSHLIDWISESGRDALSIYVLFWESMLVCRDRGYRYFDIGGLDPQTWPGVAQFKRNLRAEKYCLVGEHCYSQFPLLFRRVYPSYKPVCQKAKTVCQY